MEFDFGWQYGKDFQTAGSDIPPPPSSKTKQQNTNGFPFLLLSQSLWFVPAVPSLYRYGIF
jgi:hypothetical protein